MYGYAALNSKQLRDGTHHSMRRDSNVNQISVETAYSVALYNARRSRELKLRPRAVLAVPRPSRGRAV